MTDAGKRVLGRTSRFERKILVALVTVALVPLVGALVLGQRALSRKVGMRVGHCLPMRFVSRESTRGAKRISIGLMRNRALHHASRLLGCLAVLTACDGSDLSHESNLAEAASRLGLTVTVIGTADPATPRRLKVELDGNVRDDDDELYCPVIAAAANVNGLALEQFDRGGSIESGSVGGCRIIRFELELDDQPQLDEDTSELVIEDGSGRIALEAENFFRAPAVELVAPVEELVIGEQAELAIEPGPEVLPVPFVVRFSGATGAQSFSLDQGDVEMTARGVRFVVPDIEPGDGTLDLRGSGVIKAFRGVVTRCDAAASCAVLRAACATSSCTSATSVPDAFDRLQVPVAVVP